MLYFLMWFEQKFKSMSILFFKKNKEIVTEILVSEDDTVRIFPLQIVTSGIKYCFFQQTKITIQLSQWYNNRWNNYLNITETWSIIFTQ